ncbi:pyridoxamine 5'-phosphate oxidase-related, FMN-binding protein [Desulforamulus reducens MI-1]|uniref:Pyridoxamine 5'-phosphate oxidase-related, FMN-binding protein n=1 Tax=Desulforamulus reducens (strain ATCC BAA-1160 / DSM 100696 / MI-1) TaxID=349161 RepID=A4J1A2_DESRM|nr:pyridoxamine 5'-phosphate oxidase family protein [Desulforamulus reducens]ABO48855.1 pyridoxamine 5'-phosphate oxidase-related, FMN-binding protein [Desulforamulus reducens MI-1]
MQEVVRFLNENSTGFLATAEEGKPKVRPFQFMLEDDGKLYFCTANTKDVFKQLKVNPFVEFSASTPQFAWIRLSGEVKFSNDLGIKEKILERSALVKSIYQTADNPVFEAFYIEHGTAVIADFSGQPPKVVEF